jgi:hypothetical protein
MEIDQLMEFAHAYAGLGSAIQAQLHDIVNGDRDDINPNALQEINRALRGYNVDLDAAIDGALEDQRRVS